MPAFDTSVAGTNISSATTTVCRQGPGRFYGIVVNKAVINGVITIYDNTAASGTKLATITHPAALLASQYFLDFKGIEFSIGLTVVTGSTDDITVMYTPR